MRYSLLDGLRVRGVLIGELELAQGPVGSERRGESLEPRRPD